VSIPSGGRGSSFGTGLSPVCLESSAVVRKLCGEPATPFSEILRSAEEGPQRQRQGIHCALGFLRVPMEGSGGLLLHDARGSQIPSFDQMGARKIS
jgi:hypothetical protein